MWHTARRASLDETSLRTVVRLGEEVVMDEKPESETRPDPVDAVDPVDADAADGDQVTRPAASPPLVTDSMAAHAAAGLPPDATAPDAAATQSAAADELPAGSTVPAGYVAVPVGSSTANRAARRAVWRSRWKRFWAPALVGLILGGLLGSGITALAMHDRDNGPRFRPGFVRVGPGFGQRVGPGFPGGPGNRGGGPRFPGVPQNPQAPQPTPSQSG